MLAPRAEPLTTSCSSCEDVRITTGRSFVRSSARIRRRTSRPSTRGSFRSRRTRAGSATTSGPAWPPVPKRKSSASTPSPATTTRFAMLFFLNARNVSATSSALSSTSRMIFSTMLPFLEGEPEGGPLALRSLRPDAAAVPVDDPLNGCKPDTGAGKLGSGVEALERAEELVGIGHVEADTVVPNEIDRHSVQPLDPEIHACLGPLRREFEGVAEEVLQDESHELRVSLGRDAFGNMDFDVPTRLAKRELRNHAASHLAQVDVFLPELRARNPGKPKQVVDEVRHAGCGRAHAPERVASRFVEPFSAVLEEDLAEPVDRP